MTEIILAESIKDFSKSLSEETNIDAEGKCTLSIRGVERFFGIKSTTFQKHLTRRTKSRSKLLKRLVSMGFDPLTFSENGVPDSALGIIGHYFARNNAHAEERSDMLASMGARVFLQKIKGWQAPTYEEPNEFKRLGYAIDAILEPLHMDPSLQAGIRAEAICSQHPELRPAIEATKKHLLLETKDALLSPTELGKRMDPPISAIKVNKLLIANGLQEKSGTKSPPYLPAGRGHDHSKIVADTARGHSKTIQKLVWYESVLELL